MAHIAWTAAPDGAVLWFNRRFYEYTGLPEGAAVGWDWGKVIHPADLQSLVDAVITALQTGEPLQHESRVKRFDGEMQWLFIQALPVRNPLGEILRWCGTATDIHARILAEEALKRAEEELEQRVKDRTAELEAANAEMQGFTYSVSHDLRGPLRAIVSTSHMLLEDVSSKLSEDEILLLRRQEENAKKMAALIDDLLRLSRLGRQEMVVSLVDLTDMAHSILTEWDPKDSLIFDIQEGLEANGDPKLLRLVLENLMGNAIKFSPNGGRVSIGVVQKPKGKAFYVRDEGIGFDMSYVEKLFLPFERLHMDDEFPGTGIGLANVKRIIERHGGHVWAESAGPGTGSTFYFSLP